VESAQFDASRQVEQIRQAIKNAAATKLAAILVSGVKDEELRPVAHEAAEAGLEWALLNEAAFIDDVRSQHPDRAIFAVASDQVEIGHITRSRCRRSSAARGACCVSRATLGTSQLRSDWRA